MVEKVNIVRSSCLTSALFRSTARCFTHADLRSRGEGVGRSHEGKSASSCEFHGEGLEKFVCASLLVEQKMQLERQREVVGSLLTHVESFDLKDTSSMVSWSHIFTCVHVWTQNSIKSVCNTTFLRGRPVRVESWSPTKLANRLTLQQSFVWSSAFR
jgi:hypothetical protein